MILVIDDDPGVTELITDVLEDAGHPVLVAHNAQQALDVLALHSPEIVMTDLMMPSMDGLSLAATLRHSSGLRGVPFIAISGSDGALALADRLGDFDAHISKPFDTLQLIETVERFIGVPQA